MQSCYQFGDGVTALIASGIAVDDVVSPSAEERHEPGPDVTPVPAMDEWWFADEAHRQAFLNRMEEFALDWMSDDDGRQALRLEVVAAGGQRRPIEGGVSVHVDTRIPPPIELSHEKMTGAHTHQHEHGGEKHTHSHFHNDANVHNHGHNEAAVNSLSRLAESERRRVDGANEVTDPEALAALVASAFEARGGIAAWTALRESNGLTAAVNADGTVEPASWHAYLCAEGVRTDDGRELQVGSCRYPDLPVSMRLLIEDEGGHWGAVTCGRIDVMEPVQVGDLRMHYSEGPFGSDSNGQLAELMVEEQTQRFVSIDPRDVTAEWVEVAVNVDVGYESECFYDCWLRIADCVIGAATIVSMPALPQAVITLSNVDLPEAPIANAAAPPSLGEIIAEQVDDEIDEAVAASGGVAPARPRRAWFDDPGFHVGDARLVLQADGRSYACPLTVDEPDETGLRRVFGHVAWWNCNHTGKPGMRVKPPRSTSGYADYLTAPGVVCDDNSIVPHVGTVTMGCGHAPLTKFDRGRHRPLTAKETVAHYDGGPDAVSVFTVRAGQDDFGPWVAGYVNPSVTDEQLREAMTLNMSGDWRDIGGNLEMVAVLLVPVPGFPVRRALAASGAPELVDYDTRCGFEGERVFALVAAGMVRRVPDGERIAALEQRLARAESLLQPLALEHARRIIDL